MHVIGGQQDEKRLSIIRLDRTNLCSILYLSVANIMHAARPRQSSIAINSGGCFRPISTHYASMRLIRPTVLPGNENTSFCVHDL